MVNVQHLCRALVLRSAAAFGRPHVRQLRPHVPRNPLMSSSSVAGREVTFPVLRSQFESNSADGDDTRRRNRDVNLPIFDRLRAIRAAIENADEETRSRERSSRKLTVRERIDHLRDGGSDVFDVGLLAGWDMPYGRVLNASNAVVVTEIAGETCVVSANMWTFKGGTLYPISVKKQLRAQEISMENRLPCIYLVDSGGAFLPLQAEVFPDRYHGGRVFRNQANLSSMGVPQVSVVCGPCTAGGAYIPTMSDEAVIVRGIGSLYLAGPPLVQAATGEKISTEELGGADVHCGISGCTDHHVETEEEGFEVTRRIVSSLNLSRHREGSQGKLTTEAPSYCDSEETFADLLPPTLPQGQWPALEVVARVVDGSRFHPFKEKYGQTLHTGFARIDGRLVGILASDGELTVTAATKGTHFVRLCTFRDIPIVFFQNTPSDADYLAPGGNEGLTVKARAQMMSAVACATVPKITVVVGGSFGPSSFAMGGRALQPNFLLSWPHARQAIASPAHQLQAMREQGLPHPDQDPSLPERLEEEASIHPPSNLVTDAVILPHETRQVLSRVLEICSVYRQPPPSPAHTLNVLRM